MNEANPLYTEIDKLRALNKELHEALKSLRTFMKDDNKFRMQIHTMAEEFEAYKIFENCDKAIADYEAKEGK